ncbi:hypothetical protein L596_014948 [Steinernema carpocapsae]|uniref:Phosphoglycerate mutase family protein n=1 Tax=Steinernema carpocapsae TaxID=34508 RepID=A0A4U5NEF4_STECR|nr:hypothetical protein L596_014948 [Steinernema carpocapsae]
MKPLMQDDGARKTAPNLRIATLDRHKTFQNRKVVMLVRNAERLDRVFPEWLQQNITDTGEYFPNDLNMSPMMFNRPEGPQGFVNDAPITEIGSLNAQMIGRAIRLHDVWPLTAIFCSPTLRCVQTAASIAKGINKPVPVCVEPALFDWCQWYKSMPTILPVEELLRCGFPIAQYETQKNVEQLTSLIGNENIEQFYARIQNVVEKLTSGSNADRILIVAHATVLDAVVKALQKCSPRLVTETDMLHMGTHYPYSCCVTMAQHQGNWNFVHEPICQLSFMGISNRVNAKFVNRTTKAKDVTSKRTMDTEEPKKKKKVLRAG